MCNFKVPKVEIYKLKNKILWAWNVDPSLYKFALFTSRTHRPRKYLKSVCGGGGGGTAKKAPFTALIRSFVKYCFNHSRIKFTIFRESALLCSFYYIVVNNIRSVILSFDRYDNAEN